MDQKYACSMAINGIIARSGVEFYPMGIVLFHTVVFRENDIKRAVEKAA